MTDVVALAQKLNRKIKWQQVPETVDWVDQVDLITDAIETLYVISGRNHQFSDELFEKDEDGVIISFANDMTLAEREWVLLRAQVEFYKAVQSSHDDDTSYTTDAMSVTHGDKPYEHIGQTIDRLEKEMAVIWTRMVEYNQLGVSG